MMSKAAFMMQDHLRRNYVMITDVRHPNTFFVRGRLPFPQGLMAIAVLFKNKRPADVYAHPYFVEKQSDPSQPSPQLHLTEESQGIMKIISGLRYMRDDNTKLDNTMLFVTDYKVPVEGRMPCVPAEAAEPRVGPNVATWPRSPSATDPHASLARKKKGEGLSLEQRALLRRSVHHVQQTPGGGGDAGLGLGGTRNPVPSGSAATPTGTATPAGEQSALPGYSTFPTAEDCAADAWAVYRFLKAAIFGRRALKEEEERSPTHRINAAALFETREGGYTVLYNPIEVNEKTFVELLLKLQREERVVKAIVVPARPAWRQLQAWADVFPDAELLCSGEVPLICPPGGVPNPKPSSIATGAGAGGGGGGAASSAASTPPRADTRSDKEKGAAVASAETSSEWRGGCQDLGNGLTGLSFPEVDLEAEAEAERQRAAAAAARARATLDAARRDAEMKQQQQRRYHQIPRSHGASQTDREHLRDGKAEAVSSSSSSTDPYAEQRRRQQEKIRLRRELAEEEEAARHRSSVAAAQTSRTPSIPAAAQHDDEEGDLVDVLWQDASFFTERAQQPAGLRESDADRLRLLSPRPTSHAQTSNQSSGSSTYHPTDHVLLTPTIELIRVPGDAAAEEYVLYDANSNTLACTDLYHGAYADLDPANSWMCRVWFKFMKRGDYKRTDIAPRYKWLQVLRQHSLPTLQNAVDELTRTRPIRYLLFAHGTPPLQGGEGVNLLRQQWSLPPLHPAEMPRGPREGQ
jgi:hypothetical protein